MEDVNIVGGDHTVIMVDPLTQDILFCLLEKWWLFLIDNVCDSCKLQGVEFILSSYNPSKRVQLYMKLMKGVQSIYK